MGTELQINAAPTGSEVVIGSCWNELGVYGNGRCPQLQQFIHCRNCPIFASAGAQLLNRPLPTTYRAEWTEHFAVKARPRERSTASAVSFRLEQEWLALPTQALQEVAERRQIRSLPHRRQGAILGLVNVRGELLLGISLGHLLGLTPQVSATRLRTSYHRLLVANWNGQRFAFPVDEVRGPHRFQAGDLKPPPAAIARSTGSYTQGVLVCEERAVGLLDADLLVSALNRSLT